MSIIGTEVECAEAGCSTRFVKRSPAHRYCERCRVLRKRRAQSLYYKIKGSEHRKRKRKQRKS